MSKDYGWFYNLREELKDVPVRGELAEQGNFEVLTLMDWTICDYLLCEWHYC